MKILFLILLISGATITFYDVSALCIDPHCYAITITNELDTNYQGLQYVIEIPGLYIDEQSCEEMGAVVTGWVNIQRTILDVPRWIENGVTVGWIDPPDEIGRCVTTESAYFAYSIASEEGEQVYVEDLIDPHGDPIGIKKNFAIEKNSDNLWLIKYGDSQGLNTFAVPLDFGNAIATGVDFGAEGTID